MGYGADTEANALLTSLTDGLSFNLPAIDLSGTEFVFPGGAASPLYQEVTKLANADLTGETLEGNGAFDALMRGFKAHLREEYDRGRITGAEYTKAYTELTIAAMSNATQFLLGREATYWQAITSQMSAITGRAALEVEKARVVTAQFEANNMKANFALTKLKLTTEDTNYGIADYNLTNLMPMQLQLATEQTETARAQTMDTRLDGITPVAGIAGAEIAIKTKQEILIEEQTEAQRAQTMDTRMDGTTLVAGAIGKQKDLHTQQIDSYQRSDETKAAKIYADAFITMKTLDEGLTPPNEFTNTVFDQVFSRLRTVNSLT